MKAFATTIRQALQDDVPSILGIYNEVIASSTAIYADDPVSLDNRMAWFAQQEERGFPVLVGIASEGDVIGFSAFADWRGAWPGYRHTVEHSVHVRRDRRGAGVGQHLIEALFPYAQALGKHVMIGGIDASNSVSIRLHERLGFQQVAHFRGVGRKFDRWLDLVFMQRVLDAT
jgi:L-amino acid N-acyltransferase YncA